MALVITTSPNISELNVAIDYNLNAQEITLTEDCTFIGSGANNVQGIDFVLTSPEGLVYWENDVYGASADIDCASPTPFVKSLPVFEGVVQTGVWTVKVSLKDENGTIYSYTATQMICLPPQCDDIPQSGDGCAVISFTADCPNNKTVYQDRTNYVYQNTVASSVTYSVDFSYPIGSGLSPITNANVPFFTTTPIYTGLYGISVENVAIYEFTNNTTVTVTYTSTKSYNADCEQSLCGILCVVAAFVDKVLENQNAGTNSSRLSKYSINNLVLLNSLVEQAQIRYSCGQPFGDLIEEIEILTGASCSNCAGCGSSSHQAVCTEQNIAINGSCGTTVTSNTVGLTTTFTVKSQTYTISTSSAGVTITTTTPDSCTTHFDFAVCLENLAICSSTAFLIADGNGGNTIVNAGDTYSDVVGFQNNATVVMEGRLTTDETNITALQATPTWINTGALSGSWVASTTTQYSKSVQGWVSMRGSMQKNAPAAATTFYTLPVGYRPAVSTILPITFSDSGVSYFAGVVLISTAGVCQLVYAGTGVGATLVSLDGLRFSTT